MNFGIALGSNLGDRLGNLREAVRQMLAIPPAVRLVAAAPLYETAPVDCPEGSAVFLNSVVEVACGLEPLTLLDQLRTIESRLGRPRDHAHHGPRTVDLDILYAGEIQMQHPDLTLPHPRLHLRRFVLQPMADIRPERVLPGQMLDIKALLDRLPQDEPPLSLVLRDWLEIAL